MENETGRPFVGPAGQLLDKMIFACGWRREDVYICNVIKCRCPNNRAPEKEEIANCRPFLNLQLKTVAPQLIICLGASAAHGLLSVDSSISHLRGRLFDFECGPLKCKVLCTYHPSYILHIPEEDSQRKKLAKQMIWSDLKIGLKYLKECDDSTSQNITIDG